MFRAETLGPVIEFANLSDCEPLSDLRAAQWFEEGSLTPVLNALTEKKTRWLASDGRRGLLIGRGLESEDHVADFKFDAHKAALAISSSKTAALIVAAIGELAGNVIDHSEAGETGIALFSTDSRTFEFVVADSGIGILKSLTRNPEYAHFQDESTALAAAVESGVSRFNRNTGHGSGFRPIFEKLADMTGRLRFRSGGYALSLDGRFGDRISRQISQKPKMPGFFAAVTCQFP